MIGRPPASVVETRLLRMGAWRAVSRGHLRRRLGKVTLAELEDSRRPLLFSRLPRMLRGDGGTPKSLQAAFVYVEQDHQLEPASPVSVRRWTKALATSRRLASRRSARRSDELQDSENDL